MARKYGKKRKRNGVFLILALMVGAIIIFTLPVINHVAQLMLAQKNYDMEKVQKELAWFNEKGTVAQKFPVLRDAELWFRLNMGETEGIEKELAGLSDEKHQFWLFLYYINSGEVEKGTDVLKRIEDHSLSQLGQAIIYLLENKAEEANQILKSKPTGLKRHEKALWNLYLAQSYITLGHDEDAEKTLDLALSLEPKNPLFHMAKLRFALGRGKISLAQEMIAQLDEIPWLSEKEEYLTLKGMFYLADDSENEYEETLEMLMAKPDGEAYAEYLKGLKALACGELREGKDHLIEALDSGLSGSFKADAELALKQTEERLAVEDVFLTIR